MSAAIAAAISIASAAWLWIWAAAAGGRIEAWDGPYYFSRVVPATWAIAAGCGFLAPRMAWCWPALMYATQFVLMIVRTEGTIGPLAPLGFLMMAVLAGVAMLPAYAGVFASCVFARAMSGRASSRARPPSGSAPDHERGAGRQPDDDQ